MASCRDTPGWPMSTTWTSSPTERSPRRSTSTIRRRVGSARTWKTSATTTYYYSDIYRVNDISSGRHPLDAPQLGQHLGQFGRRLLRVLPAHVDHLLGDSQLEVLARHLDDLALVLAVPQELDRAPDLLGVAADRAAGVLELADQVLDRLGVA